MSSSSPPPGQQGFDGGQDFDAHVDYDGALPDGALPDLTVPPLDAGDAADVAPVLTTVTVRGTNGLPKAGVPVIFQDAAGAIVEAKTTDALGQAARTIVDGSMVTVAAGGAGLRELFTFVGVKNGDAILALDVAPGSASSQTLLVSVPAAPPAGTTQYQVLANDCVSAIGAPPITAFIEPRCQANGNAPVIAYAFDANFGYTGWAFGKNNPLNADGGQAPGAATSPWYTAFGTYNIAVINAPSNLTQVGVANAEIAAGVPFHQSDSIAPTEGAGSRALRTLPGYADAFQPQVSTSISTGNLTSASFLAKSVAPAASGATQTFDLAQLWPLFTSTATNSSTLSRPTLLWTLAGALPGANGGFARVQWTAAVDGGFEPDGWTFIFPPGTASVQGPLLPAALAAWAPPLNTSFGVPDVAFVGEDDIPSFDAFLTQYVRFTGLPLGLGTPYAPVLPAGATLRAVGATNGG